MPPALCSREEVGVNPRGIRWSLWPITLEDYTGDVEPDMTLSRQGLLARPRFMAWKRLRRTDIPNSWRQMSKKTWRIDGVMLLASGQDYTARWHKNARRELRLFKESLASGVCRIERILWEDYVASYHQSLIAKRVDTERLRSLEYKLAYPDTKEHIELWGVRNATGKIIAGSAIIYSPTYQGSTHFAPFILPEARMLYAATGLMDHWFAQTRERGYRFAMTTNFWFKGLPKKWKGFSEFKSHFGFRYIIYPPILYKFVWGKIF